MRVPLAGEVILPLILPEQTIAMKKRFTLPAHLKYTEP
jgi:hypothetical protein